MIDPVRFGWLGESRRIELHALLVREVSEWSREWWMAHSAAAIDVYPLDEWASVEESPATWRVGAGTLQLIPHKGEAALGSHLAAHLEDDASALAARVGGRSLADLASRLGRRAGAPVQVVTEDKNGVGAYQRLELGAYMATLSLGSYTLALAMDRAFADLLAPPKHYEKAALTSRSQAINGANVSLEVCIPLGSAQLSQLDDLRIGEVLVGDALLTAPVEVRVTGVNTVAFARLGEGESSRVITLTHSI
ncbi:hypothetical protein ISN76_07720 [Dyella halodurans]|uniref:Flagellar motor switch protein FliN-like C-terminal domain-containing protein n=1 Tax=Dyella halodurans TaxID=1920171 RepID=A0ABV9C3F2_9GAMM|nr:hypothetical protein [Dyella halodurans]